MTNKEVRLPDLSTSRQRGPDCLNTEHTVLAEKIKETRSFEQRSKLPLHHSQGFEKATADQEKFRFLDLSKYRQTQHYLIDFPTVERESSGVENRTDTLIPKQKQGGRVRLSGSNKMPTYLRAETERPSSLIHDSPDALAEVTAKEKNPYLNLLPSQQDSLMLAAQST
jgi:hypothetical protein